MTGPGPGTAALRMEWIKLRSLRSTWWTLAVAVAGMAGIGIAIMASRSGAWAGMSARDRASFDALNSGFTGVALAQLVMAVLGVLAITGEYSSGMIASTLAAVPRRRRVLAAKAAVLGLVTLAVGEAAAFATFLAAQAVARGPVPHATLGQPGALRAVVLTGAYLALCALIGLGAGALTRRAAAAITIITALILVLPPLTLALPAGLQQDVQRYLPEAIAGNSLAVPATGSIWLAPWAGLGVVALYAAAALAAGTWRLTRRDA
jgi:ABC-2 type transport system permease protein